MNGIFQKTSLILLFVLAAALALVAVRSRRSGSVSGNLAEPSAAASQQIAERFARFAATEKRIDQTIWAKELLAEQCGRTVDGLWDALNASTNKLSVLRSFPVGEVQLGAWGTSRLVAHGIELRQSQGIGRDLSAREWPEFVLKFERAGWELARVEFRQNQFDKSPAGQPGRSHYYFSAHLTRRAPPERAIVEGDLVVDWAATQSRAEMIPIRKVDATGLAIKTRLGPPAFQPLLIESITPPDRDFPIDPLIAYDLDGDGISEIIFAGKNRVYHRQGGTYRAEALCRFPATGIFTAVIADFDGDGRADFLCATSEGLRLFQGSDEGRFDQPGQLVWRADRPLKNPMVLTCGDIDHDGYLDLFLAQYKVPTLGQILRPNYYDANDSDPAYLLLNDGRGHFRDATAAAGLEKKRGRRTFSASFVDLDEDGHLDLLVASDFTGIDLYRNDGHGRFTDVTLDWIDEPHAFGMAHALADFNRDGHLDFLVIGMNSPTADRLEHLGLARPGFSEDPSMRARMTFGNRLYLAKRDGGFQQTPLGDSIARSGWSWGCSAFDFDNDGFPDVYIANGHESKKSVRDYDAEFWLHDIYIDRSVDDLTATTYFLSKFERTRGQGWSYGGYEKNRLYLNQRGSSFLEAAHLMGVALEEDSRNVVADDLNGDGRMDLIVTTFEVWPKTNQTVRVYENNLPDSGNWIGFRFKEEGPGKSPVGVRVTIEYGGCSATRQIVTGDSFRSQHANTVHFGLGAADRVESAEIRWPDSRRLTLRNPLLNRYHAVQR